MYDRDALLAAVDLVALADELLGPHTGSHANPAWPCPSPTHAQTGRTPPLRVFTTRWGQQRWRCFGCGDGGTAIDLVIAAHQTTTREAFDHLARRTHTHPPPTPPVPRTPQHRDPQGLARYVDRCAHDLWAPAGRPILRWLTHDRALLADVLRLNHIGADTGATPRPKGMPRAAGAVLPTIVDDTSTYAQIRVVHPGPDRLRYLNPTWDLAPNPKLTTIHPLRPAHREVLVTEGTIDALSAATAGYQAVALLGAAIADPAVAASLARIPRPLVLALDPDQAGHRAADQLTELLATHRRTPTRLALPGHDLNDLLAAAPDRWSATLAAEVGTAMRPTRSNVISISR